jgi:hypothetical protein
MVVRQPQRFIVQRVHIRRFQHRIAVASNVAISLIVRDHEDDIRPGSGRGHSRRRCKKMTP